MKFFFRLLLVVSLFTLNSFSFKKLDFSKARNKNVCKTLQNDVLVYMIFIDSKQTAPWTEFDIQSTLDSLNVAISWLKEKADQNNVPLKIKTDYYIGEEFATIKKNLPQKSVIMSLQEPSIRKGMVSLNRWADFIAKKAGGNFYIPEKDGIPEIKKPKNKERLVAFLRDEHSVESVVLLYMVNNYYKEDISISINSFDTEDVEFSIVSYKYPSEIAHNILQLFGAADMHETIFRRHNQKLEELGKLFPNDIMQDPYGKKIFDQKLSEYTKYLIGWRKDVSDSLKPYLFDKRAIF